MIEKRKFKVLWFATRDGDMKRNARSYFEEAAERLGCDYEADFEHDFVWPMEDREATKRRIAAQKYDLILVDPHPRVIEVANDFCESWGAERMRKVVLWMVHLDSKLLSKKMHTARVAYFVEDFFSHADMIKCILEGQVVRRKDDGKAEV